MPRTTAETPRPPPEPNADGRHFDEHVDALARALYAMNRSELESAARAIDQLGRLAQHYLRLQEGTSGRLSCAHLCQARDRPVAPGQPFGI